MYQIFRNFKIRPVTPLNLPEVIRTFQGAPMTNFDNLELMLPPSFKLHSEDDQTFIRKELQFRDFKEAFAFFNFIVASFDRLNYRPRVFNVYNRITVDFSDVAHKVPTTKEIFLARYLAELLNNPLKAAEKTLAALNESPRD